MTKSYIEDKSGATIVIFALLLGVVMLFVGAAVDFTNADRQINEVQVATDAAALTAAKSAVDALDGGATAKQARRQAKREARITFRTNLAKTVKVDKVRTQIEFSDGGRTVTATTTAEGAIPTSILSITGISDVPYNRSGSASYVRAKHLHINFLLDTSASMGIAATKDDAILMENSMGCAFACHSPPGSIQLASNIDEARAIGATLRLDAAKRALSLAIDKLKSGENTKFAIHTFSNYMVTNTDLTQDQTHLQQIVSDIGLHHKEGQGGTSYDYVLDQARVKIGKSADGSTSDQPKKYLILITDGVASNARYDVGALDPWGSLEDASPDPNFKYYAPGYHGYESTGMWTVQGFNPDPCKPIKSNNVELFVLHVDYLGPVEGISEKRLDVIAAYLDHRVERDLKACASSPDHYMMVSEGTKISDVMQAISDKINSNDLALIN